MQNVPVTLDAILDRLEKANTLSKRALDRTFGRVR
jgi:hypothetical protein